MRKITYKCKKKHLRPSSGRLRPSGGWSFLPWTSCPRTCPIKTWANLITRQALRRHSETLLSANSCQEVMVAARTASVKTLIGHHSANLDKVPGPTDAACSIPMLLLHIRLLLNPLANRCFSFLSTQSGISILSEHFLIQWYSIHDVDDITWT